MKLNRSKKPAQVHHTWKDTQWIQKGYCHHPKFNFDNSTPIFYFRIQMLEEVEEEEKKIF